MFQRDIISLFFVINAIGNIPLFLAMLSPFDHKRQRIIILREYLIALSLLLVFNFFGVKALDLIGISPPMLGIAGGAVLFLIAISMIFPKPLKGTAPRSEPIAVPLAIPAIAGPGAITSVMIFSHQASSPLMVTAALCIAMSASAVISLGASSIKHLLGEKGLIAIERLGGMIFALIGVQMIMTGIATFVKFEFFGMPYAGS